MGEEKSKKTDIIPIVFFICFVSVILLLMLFMLFALYYRAFDAIVEGKIPIDKLDLKMSDGFIGATATLIGIMITFVIGYQILNALQIKKDIEEFKGEINKDIDEVKSKFGAQVEELTNQKSQLESLCLKSNTLQNEIESLNDEIFDIDIVGYAKDAYSGLHKAFEKFSKCKDDMNAYSFILSYIYFINHGYIRNSHRVRNFTDSKLISLHEPLEEALLVILNSEEAAFMHAIKDVIDNYLNDDIEKKFYDIMESMIKILNEEEDRLIDYEIDL